MKKLLLVSATTISLVMACGAGSGKSECGDCKKSEKSMHMQQKGMQKGMKKSTPFLIKKGLPHMTKLVKKNWDNPELALTAEQKEKLLVVRKNVMGMVKRLKPEVSTLEKEIIQASRAGESSDALKSKIEKLASLETEATLGHLGCIEQTKAILTKEQTKYLLSHRK